MDELSVMSRITTPADTIYQKDIRGHKLPPEFPPEVPPDGDDGKKTASADGNKGRNVDFSI